jgi:hypothetical protein
LFLFGQLSFTAVALVILYGFVYPKNTAEWTVWLSLIVCLGMGSGPGYFTQRWARSGVLLIGGWIGGLFGAVFYTAVVAKYTENNPLLALWLTVIFFAVLLGVLS